MTMPTTPATGGRRRALLTAGAAAATAALAAPFLAARPLRAQGGGGTATTPFTRLQDGGFIPLPPQVESQRFTASPAPPGPPGRWEARAMLPLPRSEMAWGVAAAGRLHLVGGYGLGRVDRPYHQAYDPAADAWRDLAPLPLGANHVGVVAAEGDGRVIYAMGGFTDQNRNPHREAFAYDVAEDRWRAVAPMPRPRGAASLAVDAEGRVHVFGGADGVRQDERRSRAWHEVYDPCADRWEARGDMPGFPLDHKGVAVVGGRIHLVGGRIDTFATNVAHHRAYDPAADRWESLAPMPTPRSGHGTALYRGRVFCLGGEETGKVFGQVESYDPATDRWQSHAPMTTPRHGLGAATLGDWVHVAGGGPVVGGGTQSAIHEAFTLG